MNKHIEHFSFWILFIFALFGMIMATIVFHEYSHYNDYKQLNVTGDLCLNLPTSINEITNTSRAAGYYGFEYNLSEQSKVENIAKNTEMKAYSISILITLLFIITFNTVLWNRLTRSDEKVYAVNINHNAIPNNNSKKIIFAQELIENDLEVMQ